MQPDFDRQLDYERKVNDGELLDKKDNLKMYSCIENTAFIKLEIGYDEVPFISITDKKNKNGLWTNLEGDLLDELIAKLLLMRIDYMNNKER